MNSTLARDRYPIEHVNPTSLVNYLKDRGWNEVSFKNANIKKFESPATVEDDEYIEIFVPSNKKFADYLIAVESVIDTIATYEDKSFEEILSHIIYFGDRIQISIPTKETEKGSIPIQKGVLLYENARDILIYSACAKIDPSIKKFQRKLKNAIQIIDQNLIGPSGYGSYVANIYCPLDRPSRTDIYGEYVIPPTREIILRVLRGLDDVKASIIEENPEPIVKNYSKGFNSNMCNSLINILNVGGDSGININASLEPIYPIPKHINSSFELPPHSKRYLEEAISLLQDDNEPKLEQELIGFPKILNRPKTEAGKGIFKLLTINMRDEKPITVLVELDEPLYQLVVDAHRDTNYIRITGDLHKIGTQWHLVNPRDLEVLEEDKTRMDKTLDQL